MESVVRQKLQDIQSENLLNEARIIVAQLALGGTELDMYPDPYSTQTLLFALDIAQEIIQKIVDSLRLKV
jgi:hypothetical protein